MLSTFSHGFSSEINGKPFQRIEMKSVKCKVVKDFYFPNMTCYAKPFNRTAYTYTIYVRFKKPLDDFYEQLFLEYRYGNIYREIGKSPKFNWCSVANNTNPIVRFYYRSLKVSGEKIIKKCPNI
ncbi:CLUMA_CG007072, isoform A [Clunio marinus]|uniref:CLUMA_CG007072, isoform A n=1 Tax=Clunio marinus TaxID=568069 RepID=A0A1J1HZZ9_9DIPT|nr:CLUMA_CG007072, isoform A [Clunio marinus]